MQKIGITSSENSPTRILSRAGSLKLDTITNLTTKSFKIPDWIDRIAYINVTDILLSAILNTQNEGNFLIVRDGDSEEHILTINKGVASYLDKSIFDMIFIDKELLESLMQGVNTNKSEQDEASFMQSSSDMNKVTRYIRKELDYSELKPAEILKATLPEFVKTVDIQKSGYALYNLRNEQNYKSYEVELLNESQDVKESIDLGRISSMVLHTSRKVTYELVRENNTFKVVEIVPVKSNRNGMNITERQTTELVVDNLTVLGLVALKMKESENLIIMLKEISETVPRKKKVQSSLQDIFKIV